MKRPNYIKRIAGKIYVGLDILTYKEFDQVIAYAPALDLSSYGNTEKEAIEMFRENLDIFLEYTTKKKTLTDELLDLGWTLSKLPALKFEPPKMDDLINTNDILKTLIAANSYKQRTQQIEIPA